ncbi:MAG: hypothetical protein CVV42_19840, partial [Candidatus Riflebacteria bacterium HGW-Riflebacteria-2]
LCLAGVCLTAIAAEAKPKKKDNPKYNRQQIVEPRTTDEQEPWLKVKFDIPEKGILLRHAEEIMALPKKQQQDLPPGLAKKVARGKRLPPGWQKKLAIGRTCPADLYAHTIQLPDHILYQLPPQPEGTMLVAIEGKVVRLIEATKTIVDVLNLKW